MHTPHITDKDPRQQQMYITHRLSRLLHGSEVVDPRGSHPNRSNMTSSTATTHLQVSLVPNPNPNPKKTYKLPAHDWEFSKVQ